MRSTKLLNTSKGLFIAISLSTPFLLYMSDCSGWGTVLAFYFGSFFTGTFSYIVTKPKLKNDHKNIGIIYIIWLVLGFSIPVVMYLNCHISSLIYIIPLWVVFIPVSVFIVRDSHIEKI
jgi:hypothetical protein